MRKRTLSKKERLALDHFAEKVEEALGDSLKQLVLFGSRARGDHEPDSDLDILVIVEQETWDVRDAVSLAASRVSLDEEILVSPKVIGQTRWEEMSGFNLHQNIQREGLRLSFEKDQFHLSPL